MPLTKMTTNVNNIQALSDRPNSTDGLTSAELKERFDKAGSDLKTYLNTVLTEELDDNFSDIPTQITTAFNQMIQTARATEYPIGRIIMFYDNLDHSNYLGFTWERCMTGKVPVGLDLTDTDFNSIGNTGGEKTHTLTVSEMPAHRHTAGRYDDKVIQNSSLMAGSNVQGIIAGTRHEYSNRITTNETGGSQAHNIMQPYEVVSYWKRVS